MSDVVFALSLLTPYEIDKPKVRVGPPSDGGYVMVNDLTSDQDVISYGIHTEYRFDEEMARRGHSVFMFDHTIDGINRSYEGMHFFREGVDGKSCPEKHLYTIDDHIQRHSIVGNRLILKMDVEGFEFPALAAISLSILERFEQLIIEFHDLHKLNEPEYRKCFISVVQKVNRYFTLFHVHANNYDGPDTFHYIDGLPVPNILELSYVKTSSVKRSQSETLYPTYLDYPNLHPVDKRLWFFPFIPTGISFGEFAKAWDRTRLSKV